MCMCVCVYMCSVAIIVSAVLDDIVIAFLVHLLQCVKTVSVQKDFAGPRNLSWLFERVGLGTGQGIHGLEGLGVSSLLLRV